MKRYFIILGVIVAIAAVAVIGLFIWKQFGSAAPGSVGTGTTGSLPSTGTQGSSGGTSGGTNTGGSGSTGSSSDAGQTNVPGGPGIVAGSFGSLSNDPVLAYAVLPTNTVMALEPNGVVATITNGQTSYLSSSTAANVIGGSFSADGKKALLTFNANSNVPQTSIFDVSSSKWTALPQGMESPVWSPVKGDSRIAYFAEGKSGTETLSTIDTANPKKSPVNLLTLHANDLTIQWVGPTQFILADKGTDYTPGSILSFDSSQGTITPVTTDIFGLETLWSTVSKNNPTLGLLFIAGNGGVGGSLQLINAAKGTPQSLAVTTLPAKCGFGLATSTVPAAAATSTGANAATSTGGTAKTTSTATAAAPASTNYLALFCGIPHDQNALSLAHLPDDYNQMALFTSDDIYEINTQNGAITVLWSTTSQHMDVTDVSTVGGAVFFINRYDNKLYTFTVQQSQ
ncbi:MAG TPA: hypothetical protein VMU07_04125 [Candidatus Paceibacterota bacterium]|nr:hypothetical protein [Candidatus Paceibacterota bacterium]